ncbi:hypothetical protein Y032_0684g1505 [Ancylostoma ceylanicum]|uniref:Tyrosine-protein kinase n=3 Tax=Ancylostoma ceylanicum TaxID=53326 RepID=A0A016WIW1_9BILA|nr:hypothetical protein Y032_0684g1505 [Ancylostoma ceylanicum]
MNVVTKTLREGFIMIREAYDFIRPANSCAISAPESVATRCGKMEVIKHEKALAREESDGIVSEVDTERNLGVRRRMGDWTCDQVTCAEPFYKKNFDFYHGFLPREDLIFLLHYVGEFLLRLSEVDARSREPAQREIILSVVCEGMPDPQQLSEEMRQYEEMEEARQGRKKYERKRGKIKNVIIRRAFGKYMVETTHLFDTLGNLIQYYRQKPGQLVQTMFMLLYPIRQQSWEYYHSDIQLGNVLGEGAFGMVRAGTLKTKSGKAVPVAIKQTKGGSDLCKAKIKEMMKEARLMRNFKANIHKNIVRIYGVAVDEQPLLLLLELVTGGALNRFLRENGAKIDVREKVIMCLGAGCGVEYLHQNQCMHRDLAARNCLITKERVVKISDFGLSRLGSHYVLKTAIKLPIRWLAPETISSFSFSLKSDVFTFGVLAYEIFSNGAEPWDGQTNAEVKTSILGGKCLRFPSSCPEKLREFFASRVFAMVPSHRATMTEVVKVLKSFSGVQDDNPNVRRRKTNF